MHDSLSPTVVVTSASESCSFVRSRGSRRRCLSRRCNRSNGWRCSALV